MKAKYESDEGEIMRLAPLGRRCIIALGFKHGLVPCEGDEERFFKKLRTSSW